MQKKDLAAHFKGVLADEGKLKANSEALLKATDKDNSGMITKSEMAPLMKQHLASVGSDQPLDETLGKVFQYFDKNEDGKLNSSEF